MKTKLFLVTLETYEGDNYYKCVDPDSFTYLLISNSFEKAKQYFDNYISFDDNYIFDDDDVTDLLCLYESDFIKIDNKIKYDFIKDMEELSTTEFMKKYKNYFFREVNWLGRKKLELYDDILYNELERKLFEPYDFDE